MTKPIEEELDELTAEGNDAFRTEGLIRQLIEMVEVARAMPMSSSVMVHRDEMLDILDDLLAGLPDELRAAIYTTSLPSSTVSVIVAPGSSVS